MKYVFIKGDARIFEGVWQPSKATSAAIQRINSGRYIRQTLLERLEFIHSCRPNHSTEFLIKFYNSNKSKMMIMAGVEELDPKLFAVDVEYQESEKFWLSKLDPLEVAGYTDCLGLLSNRKFMGLQPLSKIFHNHSLKDFRQSHMRYGQDLRGFWSFSLRYDKTFKKRQKDDPNAVSNSVLCLYKPMLKSRPYVTLYNIGRHDQVYTYSTQDYRIMHDWSVDKNGKIVPGANTKFLKKYIAQQEANNG